MEGAGSHVTKGKETMVTTMMMMKAATLHSSTSLEALLGQGLTYHPVWTDSGPRQCSLGEQWFSAQDSLPSPHHRWCI